MCFSGNVLQSQQVVTYLPLQINNLLHSVVSHLPLGSHQLFPLVGAAVEEPRVDFTLLVLQGYITGQDVAVLHVLGHVWVPCSMIKHKASDESCVLVHLVFHVHDLHLQESNFAQMSCLVAEGPSQAKLCFEPAQHIHLLGIWWCKLARVWG